MASTDALHDIERAIRCLVFSYAEKSDLRLPCLPPNNHSLAEPCQLVVYSFDNN